MNRIILATLTPSLTIIQPIQAAEQMLTVIEHTANPEQLIQQMLCPSGSFNVNEARQLLFQLKQNVKDKYGINLDLNMVIDEAIKAIAYSGKFSETEIAIAQEFYLNLVKTQTNSGLDISPTIRVWEFLPQKEKKSKENHKKNKNPLTAHAGEVTLPDKMAVGFVCILSGSLLCILPFGITQGIGTGLIGTGIYSILDGVREGERPYYIDPATGTRLSDT
jgi:hypothetical protein